MDGFSGKTLFKWMYHVLSGKQTYLWPLTLYTANVAARLGYQNSLFPKDPWVLDSTNK